MLASKRKYAGLTMIEVVVSFLIIGIVVVALTPALQTYFSQNRLKGAAETLYANILFSRSTAIEKATTVNLNITSNFITGVWCYGMSSAAIACSCGSPASTTNCDLGIVSSTTYPNVTLATTLSGAATVFSASRGTPSNIGSITFSDTNNGQSVQLTLSAMGLPSLCSGSGGVADVGGYTACP